ncbi:MAG: A24 family peptidase [Pseudomonadota bacterium]
MIGQDVSDTVLAVTLLLAAPCAGSFAALLADRFEDDDTDLWGRSRCDHCRNELLARDIVPIISHIALRGRARCCGIKMRPALLFAELAALAATLWAATITSGLVLGLSALLAWVLLGLSLIDLRTFRLPDPGTLGLVLVGLLLSVAGITGSTLDHAAGATLGYIAFAGIGWVWYRWRGIEALGLGDAKLLAAAGAWVGAAALPSVLLIGCGTGLLFAISTGLAQGKLTGQLAIPFGPALALGFWITWLHGPIVF